jgi:hypothetical protein
MKKRIMSLLLVTAVILALVGCNAGNVAPTSETPADSENVGMANPWTAVDDAQSAADGAGVGYFVVPETGEQAGMLIYIEEFRYMEGIAEASGSVGAAELVIRKGLKQNTEDVSGDYHEYNYDWTFESQDGFVIKCYGNEEGKAMKTLWVSDNFSYSICVMGQGDESETYGLSDDEIKYLVEEVQ